MRRRGRNCPMHSRMLRSAPLHQTRGIQRGQCNTLSARRRVIDRSQRARRRNPCIGLGKLRVAERFDTCQCFVDSVLLRGGYRQVLQRLAIQGSNNVVKDNQRRDAVRHRMIERQQHDRMLWCVCRDDSDQWRTSPIESAGEFRAHQRCPITVLAPADDKVNGRNLLRPIKAEPRFGMVFDMRREQGMSPLHGQ